MFGAELGNKYLTIAAYTLFVIRCPRGMRCMINVTVGCPSVRLSVPSIDMPLAAAWARTADIDQQLEAPELWLQLDCG